MPSLGCLVPADSLPTTNVKGLARCGAVRADLALARKAPRETLGGIETEELGRFIETRLRALVVLTHGEMHMQVAAESIKRRGPRSSELLVMVVGMTSERCTALGPLQVR